MEQVLAERPRIKSHLCSSIPFKGMCSPLPAPPTTARLQAAGGQGPPRLIPSGLHSVYKLGAQEMAFCGGMDE